MDSKQGFCYVSGSITSIAQKHPAKIRNGKDGAKLISSNDASGYTFLGRFIDAEQAVGVSSEITQKAHSALRWLIGRKQAYRNDTQAFVSWETAGNDIPSVCANTHDLFGAQEESEYSGDFGQAFAQKLNAKIAGYKAFVSDNNNIVIMGLDSAVPGRMAITYYRELKGSEFLDRLEEWHRNFSWLQDYGKDPEDYKRELCFIGAPAPQDIAWAAYGRGAEGKNGKKLMNATVERLLPCIIDGTIFPHDIICAVINRTCNRIGLEYWEWEKCLGIACALYKGTHKEEKYSMELDENRDSRDYVYGRLLALADVIESTALSIAKENRDTNAARLMQRFADRPYSTWPILEKGLKPYLDRIHANYLGLWLGYKELLDIISTKFRTIEESMSDNRLSGEYLLGYHCQRRWLKTHQRKEGNWIIKEQKSTRNKNSTNETLEDENGDIE
jgi:CRISPR-associated protein Csd1